MLRMVVEVFGEKVFFKKIFYIFFFVMLLEGGFFDYIVDSFGIYDYLLLIVDFFYDYDE